MDKQKRNRKKIIFIVLTIIICIISTICFIINYNKSNRLMEAPLSFSPNGKYLVARTNHYYYLFKISDKEKIIQDKDPGPPNFLYSCFFSPDSRYTYNPIRDNILDITKNKYEVIPNYDPDIEGFRGFSPDGKLIFVKSDNKIFQIFISDIAGSNFNAKILKFSDHRYSFLKSSFEMSLLKENVDGNYIVFSFVESSCQRNIKLVSQIYNLKTGRFLKRVEIPWDIEAILYRGIRTGGPKIFFLGLNNSLDIIDFSTLEKKHINFKHLICTFPGLYTPFTVSYDGKMFATLYSVYDSNIKKYSTYVDLYNSDSGKVTKTIFLGKYDYEDAFFHNIPCIALSPDKKLLAVGFQYNKLKSSRIEIYDISKEKIVFYYKFP